nr:C-terminal binding protein [uncultured Rhodococcus sp.]
MHDHAPLAVYTDVDDLDSGPGVELLHNAGFRVTVLETRDPGEILAAAREASVLMVGYAQITARMVAQMPNLRLIALLSRGYDNVDLEAATAAGVYVSTVGHIATEDVAAHAWAMTWALIRRLPFFAAAGVSRGWNERPSAPPLRMSEVTVGVLGLGRIGKAYSTLAVMQAGSVLAYDPIADERHFGTVTAAPFAEILARSDVLSLHLPLTPDTSGMVDAAFLESMKPGSYLINVSRGGLVDSAALAAALDSGHLAGAGVDTLDIEPPSARHPLLGHPSVLLTPHVAYLSAGTAAEYISVQARQAKSWLQTGSPIDSVNAGELLASTSAGAPS